MVSVAGLTGAHVRAVPQGMVRLNALVLAFKMSGKRDIEDRIVRHLLDVSQTGQVQVSVDEFRREIEQADWRIISARRADKLLREKLFDGVFAVRARAFARNYRNAKLDMHFSLKDDLTPLEKFLDLLKSSGVQGLSAHFERGLI